MDQWNQRCIPCIMHGRFSINIFCNKINTSVLVRVRLSVLFAVAVYAAALIQSWCPMIGNVGMLCI